MVMRSQRSRSATLNLLELTHLAMIDLLMGTVDDIVLAPVVCRPIGGNAAQRRRARRNFSRSLSEHERARRHTHTVESWLIGVAAGTKLGMSCDEITERRERVGKHVTPALGLRSIGR